MHDFCWKTWVTSLHFPYSLILPDRWDSMGKRERERDLPDNLRIVALRIGYHAHEEGSDIMEIFFLIFLSQWKDENIQAFSITVKHISMKRFSLSSFWVKRYIANWSSFHRKKNNAYLWCFLVIECIFDIVYLLVAMLSLCLLFRSSESLLSSEGVRSTDLFLSMDLWRSIDLEWP